MELHEKISQVREAKKISRAEMATALNMSSQSYWNVETGKTELTVSRLTQIADVLEVSAMELMTGEPQKVEDAGKVRALEKRVRELEEWLEDKDALIKIKDRDLANSQESITSFIYSQIVDYFVENRKYEYLGLIIVNRETAKTEAVLTSKDIEALPEAKPNFLRTSTPLDGYALKHQLDSDSLSEVWFIQPSMRLHGVHNFFGGRHEPLDEIGWLLLEIISLGFTNDAILNFIYMKYERGDYGGITILSEEDEEEIGRNFQEWMALPEEEKKRVALEDKKTFEIEFKNYLFENKDRLKHVPERIFRKKYFNRLMK